MTTNEKISIMVTITACISALLIVIGCIAGMWATGCADPTLNTDKAIKVLEIVGKTAIEMEKIDKAMSVKPKEIAKPEPIEPPVLAKEPESECPYCDEFCKD